MQKAQNVAWICCGKSRGNVYDTDTCNIILQISKALAGADRKDLMRKLPKFIYDEEKALEVRTSSCSDHRCEVCSLLPTLSLSLWK